MWGFLRFGQIDHYYLYFNYQLTLNKTLQLWELFSPFP